MEEHVKVQLLLKHKIPVQEQLPVLMQLQRREVPVINMQLILNLQDFLNGLQSREVVSSQILLQENLLSVCVQMVG